MGSSQPSGATPSDLAVFHMTRALRLAVQGEGAVEPNPMVGCVVARGAEVIGEAWHARFGGPHAEVAALAVAGNRAAGATMYVTLEPCCHQGKTPPCVPAILQAGIREVVVAQVDPFPQVAGRGIEALRAAGVRVEVGVLEAAAARLVAPYRKLIATGRPWVIAKWAMSLDGRLASVAGDSRWISGEASRRVAHALRGRVDAVIVGRGTAQIDDPLLTARPPGARVATRIVLDSRASLSDSSQLVRTVRDAPVLVAAGDQAPAADIARLRAAGCDVVTLPGDTHAARFGALLDELGRRRMTNVLVEGGSQVLGTLFDEALVDEVHAFMAPKILGGAQAPAPVGGRGVADVAAAWMLADARIEQLDGDVYIHGRVSRDDEAIDQKGSRSSPSA